MQPVPPEVMSSRVRETERHTGRQARRERGREAAGRDRATRGGAGEAWGRDKEGEANKRRVARKRGEKATSRLRRPSTRAFSLLSGFRSVRGISRICRVPCLSPTASSCSEASPQNSRAVSASGPTLCCSEGSWDRSTRSQMSRLPSARAATTTPGRVGEKRPHVRYVGAKLLLTTGCARHAAPSSVSLVAPALFPHACTPAHALSHKYMLHACVHRCTHHAAPSCPGSTYLHAYTYMPGLHTCAAVDMKMEKDQSPTVRIQSSKKGDRCTATSGP